MLLLLMLAAATIFATTAIHSICTVVVLNWADSPRGRNRVRSNLVSQATAMGILVSSMTLVAAVESTLWASVYYAFDVLPSWEQAIYYSLVTFTTLGYGDITLPESWRLVGALEAANGVIMFGWTTALILAVLQRMVTWNESSREAEEDTE